MINYKDIKAILEEKIDMSNQVLILPHLRVDMDTIASSIGLATISKKLDRPSFILVNDNPLQIEAGTKKMLKSAKDQYDFINIEQYLQKRTEKDLLIVSDVNKTNLISCPNLLSSFQNIIIVDHHAKDEHTISTPYQFIDLTASSASEMVARLSFLFHLKITPKLAEYLLAGIAVDTQNLTRASSNTFKISSQLMEKGTSMEAIEPYFVEDFVSNRKWNRLVDRTEFQTYKAAITVGDDQEIYTGVEIAKAANCLLGFDIDASFAVGRVSPFEISISARSRGIIDVGHIMKEMSDCGGGSPKLAAARIQNQTTEEVGIKLKQKILPAFHINS